jgi:hypothetical protein
MTKEDFIGNYLQKKMGKLKLEYGLEWHNKLATYEAEAEKKWKSRKKSI